MNKFISIALLFALSACAAPVLMFTGVAAGGATLSKEKTIGSSVDDFNIWTKIKAALLKHHKEIHGSMTEISVEVSEGRVLFTGTVGSADDRLKVLRIGWEQAGVREVINEIKVPNEEEKIGFKQYSTDVWITTQVKSKMIATKEVRSINYNIETINGTVYILGVARTQSELDAIVHLAENTSNVHKVMAFVRVADQKKETTKEEHPEKNTGSPKHKVDKKHANVEYIEPGSDEEIIEIGHDTE